MSLFTYKKAESSLECRSLGTAVNAGTEYIDDSNATRTLNYWELY